MGTMVHRKQQDPYFHGQRLSAWEKSLANRHGAVTIPHLRRIGDARGPIYTASAEWLIAIVGPAQWAVTDLSQEWDKGGKLTDQLIFQGPTGGHWVTTRRAFLHAIGTGVVRVHRPTFFRE